MRGEIPVREYKTAAEVLAAARALRPVRMPVVVLPFKVRPAPPPPKPAEAKFDFPPAYQIKTTATAHWPVIEPAMAHERPTIRFITLMAAHLYEIPVRDIVSASRLAHIVWPRQVAMWICHELAQRSLPEIGMAFHRDHTTVIHAIQKLKRMLAEGDERALLAKARSAMIVTRWTQYRDNISMGAPE